MISKRLQVLKMILRGLEAEGFTFGNDPHTVSLSQSQELSEWAVACGYKGSRTSTLSLGRQFYQRLSRVKTLEQ